MSFLHKLKEKLEPVQATLNQVNEWSQKPPDDIIEFRYSICKSCEHFIKQTTTCTKCGCFMIAKVRLSGANCPIGKW
jgi:hypothetical protein